MCDSNITCDYVTYGLNSHVVMIELLYMLTKLVNAFIHMWRELFDRPKLQAFIIIDSNVIKSGFLIDSSELSVHGLTVCITDLFAQK